MAESDFSGYWLDVAAARLRAGCPAQSLEILGQLRQADHVKSAELTRRLHELRTSACSACIEAMRVRRDFRLAFACTLNCKGMNSFIMSRVDSWTKFDVSHDAILLTCFCTEPGDELFPFTSVDVAVSRCEDDAGYEAVDYINERILRAHAVETNGDSVTLALPRALGYVTLRKGRHIAPCGAWFANGEIVPAGGLVWITKLFIKLMDTDLHTLFTPIEGYRQSLTRELRSHMETQELVVLSVCPSYSHTNGEEPEVRGFAEYKHTLQSLPRPVEAFWRQHMQIPVTVILVSATLSVAAPPPGIENFGRQGLFDDLDDSAPKVRFVHPDTQRIGGMLEVVVVPVSMDKLLQESAFFSELRVELLRLAEALMKHNGKFIVLDFGCCHTRNWEPFWLKLQDKGAHIFKDSKPEHRHSFPESWPERIEIDAGQIVVSPGPVTTTFHLCTVSQSEASAPPPVPKSNQELEHEFHGFYLNGHYSRIVINGLKSRPELNGTVAIREEFYLSKSRFAIRLPITGEAILLKQDNFSYLRGGDAEIVSRCKFEDDHHLADSRCGIEMSKCLNPVYCFNCGVVLPEDDDASEYSWVPDLQDAEPLRSIYLKYPADLKLRATFGPDVADGKHWVPGATILRHLRDDGKWWVASCKHCKTNREWCSEFLQHCSPDLFKVFLGTGGFEQPTAAELELIQIVYLEDTRFALNVWDNDICGYKQRSLPVDLGAPCRDDPIRYNHPDLEPLVFVHLFPTSTGQWRPTSGVPWPQYCRLRLQSVADVWRTCFRGYPMFLRRREQDWARRHGAKVPPMVADGETMCESVREYWSRVLRERAHPC